MRSSAMKLDQIIEELQQQMFQKNAAILDKKNSPDALDKGKATAAAVEEIAANGMDENFMTSSSKCCAIGGNAALNQNSGDCHEIGTAAAGDVDDDGNSGIRNKMSSATMRNNGNHHQKAILKQNDKQQQQQQMNIISAFIKANPLTNFPLPSFKTSLPSAEPSTNSSPTNSNNNLVLPNFNSPHQQCSSNSSSANSSAAAASSSSTASFAIIPFSHDVASQGLLAIGGCRQCSKTFMDRLSLIHHFVDHFPNIFYSFEERQVPIQESRNPPPTPKPSPMGPAAANERGQFPMNGMGKSHLLSGNGNIGMNGGGGDGQKQPPPQSQVPTNELLGQLATFFGFGTPSDMPFQSSHSVNAPTPSTPAKSPSAPLNQFSAEVQPPFGANFINTLMNNIGPQMGSAKVQQSQFQFSGNMGENGGGKKHQQRQQNGHNQTRTKKRQNGQPQQDALAHGNEQEQQQQPMGKKAKGMGGIANGGDAENGRVKAEFGNIAGMPILSELPYHMCPQCCLTFAETTAFKSHLAMHEAEMNAAAAAFTMAPPNSMGNDGGGPFLNGNNLGASNGAAEHQQFLLLKCPLCDMKFSNAFRLNEHMRLHSAHSCETCQKTFMTAFDLNLHMGTHTGFTYDCKDCGKCFPCRKTLAEHNRSHRMLLSNGGNASPEASPMVDVKKVDKMEMQQQQAQMMMVENALLPFAGFFKQQQQSSQNGDGGRDRRKMRMPRKGEKSRRNATLVALESTPSPSSGIPSSTFTNPPLPMQFWPPLANAENPAMQQMPDGLAPLMGQLLMRANSIIAAEKQQKLMDNQEGDEPAPNDVDGMGLDQQPDENKTYEKVKDKDPKESNGV